MKPRLLVAAVIVVSMAALAVVWGARSGGDDALAALRTDPLATWSPEPAAGWRELGRTASDARGARPASVRSSFAVQAGSDDAFDAALAAARASAWQVYDIDRAALEAPVRRTATARKQGQGATELRGVIVLSAGKARDAATDELTIELSAPKR